MIGQTLGQYRVIGRLGEGGMGEVFHAVDEMIDREVALKMLRPELAHRADVVERFRAEATTLARLDHPRIARLYGLTRHESLLFMVMEFVPGLTAQDFVQAHGRLSWPDAITVVTELLDGLDYAHRAGIVHRDVKPANVILRADGHVKVTDFGIARVLGTARATRVGHVVGTMEYMSPEQIRGEEVDGRADLYAVGIVLFELLTGTAPFTATTEYELMRKHLEAAVPAIGPAVDAPAWLDAVVQRALAKQPADRFADAAAFRDELTARAASEPATPAPTLAARVSQAVAAATPMAAIEAASMELVPRSTPVPPTRLAGAAVPATRLAGAAAPPTGLATPAQTAPSAGLFGRLTPRHYAIAAAAAVLVIAAPFAWRALSPTPAPPSPKTEVADVHGGGAPASTVTPPSLGPVVSTPAPVEPAPAPPRKKAAGNAPAPPEKSTDPPAAVAPPPAQPPAQPPTPPSAPAIVPRPNLPVLQFERAALLVRPGLRPIEEDAVMQLNGAGLVLRDARSHQIIASAPYARIESAVYSTTEINLVLTKSVKHWLTLRGQGQTIVIRLDKTNYATIIAEFEARSGITVR